MKLSNQFLSLISLLLIQTACGDKSNNTNSGTAVTTPPPGYWLAVTQETGSEVYNADSEGFIKTRMTLTSNGETTERLISVKYIVVVKEGSSDTETFIYMKGGQHLMRTKSYDLKNSSNASLTVKDGYLVVETSTSPLSRMTFKRIDEKTFRDFLASVDSDYKKDVITFKASLLDATTKENIQSVEDKYQSSVDAGKLMNCSSIKINKEHTTPSLIFSAGKNIVRSENSNSTVDSIDENNRIQILLSNTDWHAIKEDQSQAIDPQLGVIEITRAEFMPYLKSKSSILTSPNCKHQISRKGTLVSVVFSCPEISVESKDPNKKMVLKIQGRSECVLN